MNALLMFHTYRALIPTQRANISRDGFFILIQKSCYKVSPVRLNLIIVPSHESVAGATAKGLVFATNG